MKVRQVNDWIESKPKWFQKGLAYAFHGTLVSFILGILHDNEPAIPALGFWTCATLLALVEGTKAFIELLDYIDES